MEVVDAPVLRFFQAELKSTIKRALRSDTSINDTVKRSIDNVIVHNFNDSVMSALKESWNESIEEDNANEEHIGMERDRLKVAMKECKLNELQEVVSDPIRRATREAMSMKEERVNDPYDWEAIKEALSETTVDSVVSE